MIHIQVYAILYDAIFVLPKCMKAQIEATFVESVVLKETEALKLEDQIYC